ncbi:mirror-image polydactyly gene 1 protein [Lampris incognitus]|uniref:mirror-image polydactyly gene 1 protein n=1 Tax=Lampris incognitus TaxID=2546036 RepID=UPI0024B58E2E|nr:mirror-image polydactyly gene 1 protein [Lampris incognitus]
MYKGNPRVNAELCLRLPPPLKQHRNTDTTTQQHTSTGSSSPLLSETADRPQVSSRSPLFHRGFPSTLSARIPYRIWDSSRRRPLSPLCSSLVSAGQMEADDPPAPGLLSRANSQIDGGPALAGVPVLRGHQMNPDSSSGFGDQTVDSEKNISFLLKELDSLRDLNQELKAQLVQKERELERRQVEDELREAELEAQGWERPAEKGGMLCIDAFEDWKM